MRRPDPEEEADPSVYVLFMHVMRRNCSIIWAWACSLSCDMFDLHKYLIEFMMMQ